MCGRAVVRSVSFGVVSGERQGWGREGRGIGRTPKPVTRIVRSLVAGGEVGEGPWEPIVMFSVLCCAVLCCVVWRGCRGAGCKGGKGA